MSTCAKATKAIDGQMTLLSLLDDADGTQELTSADLERVIKRLACEKRRMKQAERRERERREAEERERKEREAQERERAHVEQVTSMDLPLDWENAFFGDARAAGVHAGSASDGLVLSLANLGKVDIEYIAAITGLDCKTVIEELRGSIYQNPQTWGECFYKGWESADEYLSGRLIPKLRAAKAADKAYNGYFADNVRAIERILPAPVSTGDIYVTLGSPWVPARVIDDFIVHLFGSAPGFTSHGMPVMAHTENGDEPISERYRVCHDEVTGAWEIPYKGRYLSSIAVSDTYGTRRMEALSILERTLNLKPVVVTDEVSCPANKSGKKRMVNQAETALARERQQKLVDAFKSWVWSDPARARQLQAIFEERYGCVRRRTFDGQFLTFPTMSPAVELRPYQKDAVMRVISAPNTLLAHDVGSGKTYVMIAAGMELRRMGLSAKNLYVVPNNIMCQWRDVFCELYPQANVLCVEPRGFTPSKRERVLADIRDNDYDGIIMAYSCFERIPLSRDYYRRELEAKKAVVRNTLRERGKATSRLGKVAEEVNKALAEFDEAIDELYDVTYFDDLGITRLFVDEAHNFKNVPIQTQMKNVRGISPKGSKRCQDMLDKVRQVQRSGGGVVFATGTPIVNSVADAYVMQRFLQSGELAMLELQSFDSWIGMFAEQATGFEIDVDTSGYRMVTRFSQFHNLPELTALLSSVADFHQVGHTEGVPLLEGRTDVLVRKTPAFEDYLEDISRRADNVRHNRVSCKVDNMLAITTDGRKAALDLRLVDRCASFTYESKVARCADKVFDIYMRTRPQRGVQLVFCDTSVPKDGFNLYDELKDLLVEKGLPECEIAFVHDAKSESERERLFAAVRAGEVRVLIGSTFKLGLGVNIQNRLVALHHLDVPWRPADMTQREGRILRQGNRNAQVRVFRYITEGSFDAYSWQLLETKERFISELLAGSIFERDGADVDGAVLDYAEVKALAVGNPLVKERVETANELARLRALQRKTVEARERMAQELAELPARIGRLEELVTRCGQDAMAVESPSGARPDPKNPGERKCRANIRQRLAVALAANELVRTERRLLGYRGFDVVLPANMLLHEPYLWVERAGRYRVDMGQAETGMLVRIDNCIDGLGKHKVDLEKRLSAARDREQAITEELSKEERHADEIELWQNKLRELDAKLGVDEK